MTRIICYEENISKFSSPTIQKIEIIDNKGNKLTLQLFFTDYNEAEIDVDSSKEFSIPIIYKKMYSKDR